LLLVELSKVESFKASHLYFRLQPDVLLPDSLAHCRPLPLLT
jgi:hypothetical protein